MRTITRHTTRIALLALLIALGALVSAQAPLTLEEAQVRVTEIASSLEPAGLEHAYCGSGTTGLIVACAYDFRSEAPRTMNAREAVSAAIVAAGFDSLAVNWTDLGAADRHAAAWSVPGGTFTAEVSADFVMVSFGPDAAIYDPCADWYDVDPFDFATNAVGGTATMQQTPRVAECVGFDHEDEFGQTPLIYAITAANLTSFENVIRFSDANHRTRAGWTPLMYAARLDDHVASMFVNMLLAAGADPIARAPDGTTAAQLAAANDKIDARTRAALQPPPPPPTTTRTEIDPHSRRIAEDYVQLNDIVGRAHLEYQREIACGLLPQSPSECFVVTRSRPTMMMFDGAMYAGIGVVVAVTFHEGLDLIDRHGAERAYELIDAAPHGRRCLQRFRVSDPVNIDWTARSDGTLHLHYTRGPLQPHGDHHTPPPGAITIGPLCN